MKKIMLNSYQRWIFDEKRGEYGIRTKLSGSVGGVSISIIFIAINCGLVRNTDYVALIDNESVSEKDAHDLYWKYKGFAIDNTKKEDFEKSLLVVQLRKCEFDKKRAEQKRLLEIAEKNRIEKERQAQKLAEEKRRTVLKGLLDK